MTLRFTIGGERPHRVVEPHQTEPLGPLHEAPSTTDNPCDRAARHAFRLVAFGPTSSVAAGNLMLVSNAAWVARCRRTSSNNGCGRGWRVDHLGRRIAQRPLGALPARRLFDGWFGR
jgi:hypothetical protein